jgi:hypothetical protein
MAVAYGYDLLAVHECGTACTPYDRGVQVGDIGPKMGLSTPGSCTFGQGFTLSSGIAKLVMDYTPAVIYEGDRLPMALQTARA